MGSWLHRTATVFSSIIYYDLNLSHDLWYPLHFAICFHFLSHQMRQTACFSTPLMPFIYARRVFPANWILGKAKRGSISNRPHATQYATPVCTWKGQNCNGRCTIQPWLFPFAPWYRLVPVNAFSSIVSWITAAHRDRADLENREQTRETWARAHPTRARWSSKEKRTKKDSHVSLFVWFRGYVGLVCSSPDLHERTV